MTIRNSKITFVFAFTFIAYSTIFDSAQARNIVLSKCTSDVCKGLISEFRKVIPKRFATILSNMSTNQWLLEIHKHQKSFGRRCNHLKGQISDDSSLIRQSETLGDLADVHANLILQSHVIQAALSDDLDDAKNAALVIRSFGQSLMDYYGKTGLHQQISLFGLELDSTIGQEFDALERSISACNSEIGKLRVDLVEKSNLKAIEIAYKTGKTQDAYDELLNNEIQKDIKIDFGSIDVDLGGLIIGPLISNENDNSIKTQTGSVGSTGQGQGEVEPQDPLTDPDTGERRDIKVVPDTELANPDQKPYFSDRTEDGVVRSDSRDGTWYSDEWERYQACVASCQVGRSDPGSACDVCENIKPGG